MSPALSDHTSYSENSVFFFFYCSHDVKFSKTASPNSLKFHVAVPFHEYTFSTLSNFCFHAYLFIAVLTSHLFKLVTCCFPMSRLSSLSSVSLRLCKHSFFIVFSIYFNCIVMILFCKCHFVSVLIKTSSISAFLDHSPPWKLLWNYIFVASAVFFKCDGVSRIVERKALHKCSAFFFVYNEILLKIQ